VAAVAEVVAAEPDNNDSLQSLEVEVPRGVAEWDRRATPRRIRSRLAAALECTAHRRTAARNEHAMCFIRSASDSPFISHAFVKFAGQAA
jgi:hypothetical protein